jgi:transposase
MPKRSKKQVSKHAQATLSVPQLDSLTQINLNAAGLDVGATEIYVYVPEGRDTASVRVFPTFTVDLYALADWLTQCQVTSVAMESTGVYWIPIFQILESRGFEVYLVNAHYVKNVTGKKTDILDCQWIQQLHTYGLLHASFRPNETPCALRALVRHGEMLLQYRASHIQHMQQALHQMNVQLTKVLSDITGVTGLRIIRDMVAGNHDPQHLARHRDWRCAKSADEIAKSLQGDYRPEQLFALQQAVELYDYYTNKIAACDQEITRQFAQVPPQVDIAQHPLPPSQRPPSTRPKNHPAVDLRPHLYQMAGVDLTQVDGLDVLTVQTILSEIGVDMHKWPTVKRFTSWLGVSPQQEKAGGKVVRTKTKKSSNRANRALRQAAATLKHSKSALGSFHRRMYAKLRTPKAIVATAHKLARIVYHMLKYRVPFAAVPPDQDEAQYRERALRQLQRTARQLGAEVVIKSTQTPLEARG